MALWLMKSEPDVYSIHDLKAAGGPALWEGCRNYTVRNFMRDQMKPGDRAFFYNSNASPSGIAGTMKITREGYPDPTQFDPNSEYFDPKSSPEKPRWMAVDVEFVQEYRRVISLAELRAMPGLEDMLVLRKGQMLSVMPVTQDEWDAVEAYASSL